MEKVNTHNNETKIKQPKVQNTKGISLLLLIIIVIVMIIIARGGYFYFTEK